MTLRQLARAAGHFDELYRNVISCWRALPRADNRAPEGQRFTAVFVALVLARARRCYSA